jgi:drug/metabolite transporter (DMT)-like permease|tara:strand:+ start:172730 stop:173695 length:966 start_codon:yes stop_codon:yes gene_type:complete
MKTPTETVQPSEEPEPSRSAQFVVFGIIALGSLLFSLKGVFAKLAYNHGSDPLEILTLRMAFALPFFATTWLIIELRKAAAQPAQRLKDIAQLAALGLLGYYASSMLDFIGLQYVSASLERIILYSYPTMVLLQSARIFRQRIERSLYFACLLTWAGVSLSFFGESSFEHDTPSLLLGGGLILLCAFTYALFVVLSGRLLKRISSQHFTSGAMTFSSLFMLSHFSATRGIENLFTAAPEVLGIGCFLGICGTVIPGYLTAYGLKHTGAARFAVVSSIGPVMTLFAATYVLGEVPTVFHWVGLGLTLFGGLSVVLKKKQASD